MPVIAESVLRGVLRRLFEGAGVPEDEAEVVSDHLVDSNLAGHDSHGVIRAPGYLRQMRRGVVPKSQCRVVRETPAVAVIDAAGGLGIVAARQAMALAIEKARERTFGAVGVHRAGHTGRLGDFAQRAAEEGMIGICLLNGGARFVAPHGGSDRRLPPNPIAVGLPRRDGPPILLDMTTSVVAGGKIDMKRLRGEPIPPGWLIDGEGHPVSDADPFRDPHGAAVLPLGGAQFGHKGYGLGFIVDCLAGGLTWAGCSRDQPTRGANGFLAIAVKIDDFVPREEFETEVAQLVAWVKAGRRLPGVEEIFVPGELEARRRWQLQRDGIVVDDPLWQELAQAAADMGLGAEFAAITGGPQSVIQS